MRHYVVFSPAPRRKTSPNRANYFPSQPLAPQRPAMNPKIIFLKKAARFYIYTYVLNRASCPSPYTLSPVTYPLSSIPHPLKKKSGTIHPQKPRFSQGIRHPAPRKSPKNLDIHLLSRKEESPNFKKMPKNKRFSPIPATRNCNPSGKVSSAWGKLGMVQK
jgi:hypothetical protein